MTIPPDESAPARDDPGDRVPSLVGPRGGNHHIRLLGSPTSEGESHGRHQAVDCRSQSSEGTLRSIQESLRIRRRHRRGSPRFADYGGLRVHTTIEEEIFYPAAHEMSSELADAIDEGVEEHHVVKVLLGEIEDLEPGTTSGTPR